MKDHMKYKDYYGSVHYNNEDEVFYGKVEGIRSLTSYEGTDVKSLKQAFEEAVDDYLETCAEQSTTPEKPFKGSFNVRVGEQLHRKSMEYAWAHNTNLNTITKEALSEYFSSHGA
ncbi:MAG TPA: toxin-antitoxin system HicB family antitoxin [Holosporales bacterium]|nr:toxin-antitoxin system HicB family antitoxin [Holosporales bacterium]